MNVMNVFLLQAPAAGPDGSLTLIMIIAMVAIMYFFMIRPQNKKQKEIANFRKSLWLHCPSACHLFLRKYKRYASPSSSYSASGSAKPNEFKTSPCFLDVKHAFNVNEYPSPVKSNLHFTFAKSESYANTIYSLPYSKFVCTKFSGSMLYTSETVPKKPLCFPA